MGPRRKRTRILIVGLGNVLLKDDGVGVHAIQEFQKAPPRGTRLVEVGTAVLDALHLFEWADLILAIDAMRAEGPAGTIYSMHISGVDDPRPRGSLHELNLMAALRFLPNDNRPEILILGIEPGIIDYGLDLSPKVRAALPAVIRSAREIVDDWRRGPARRWPRGTPIPRKKSAELL